MMKRLGKSGRSNLTKWRPWLCRRLYVLGSIFAHSPFLLLYALTLDAYKSSTQIIRSTMHDTRLRHWEGRQQDEVSCDRKPRLVACPPLPAGCLNASGFQICLLNPRLRRQMFSSLYSVFFYSRFSPLRRPRTVAR